MFAPFCGARRTFNACALALFMTPNVAVSGDTASGAAPSSIVTSLNQQALPLVNADTLDTAALENVIEAHADVDSVLKRALKRQWRSLSDMQLTELKAQTLKLVGRVYASAMRGVNSKDIAYKAKRSKPASSRVSTTVPRTPATFRSITDCDAATLGGKLSTSSSVALASSPYTAPISKGSWHTKVSMD